MEITAAATGGDERWAAGGGRQAANGDERQAAAKNHFSEAVTFTLSEAAAELGIPVRTLRDWVNAGIAPAIEPLPPARGRRISAEVLEDLRRRAAASGGTRTATGGDERQAAASSSGEQRWAAADPDSSPLNTPRHAVSPGAAGGESPAAGLFIGNTVLPMNHRAELAEQKAALLESDLLHVRADMDAERARLCNSLLHLQATVERQAEQITRHSVAEEQLRVMLMKLEATNAELAGALVQKALPPAPEEKPRVRWWRLWR